MKNKILEDFENIEKEFFDIDEAGETARVCLHFASPDEIFDVNCISKIPIFNDDFDEWLQSAFEMIPSRYRINLEVTFDDMGGYTSAELDELFKKNLLLSGKSIAQSIKFRKHIAISLIIAGVISFIAMVLIGNLWTDEGIWHDVFFYLLDIATTVLFWEAAGILLVENREHHITLKAYGERFASVSFKEAERPLNE